MANIIDDSLSGLQAIDPEHILDLSEVGEEEIDTLSEAIREVVTGVNSVNGMTGDVTLTADDLDAYTKNEVDDNFATKNDIKITIDGQTYTTSQAFADMLAQELTGTFNEIFNNLDGKEIKSNKVSSISGTGDTYRYPNTKAVYDYVSPIQSSVSTVQTNISGIQELIPNQATTTNQLADKAFVNSSVQTATANFRGNWTTWANVPTNANDYPADYASNKTPTVNDYLVVQDASDYTGETLEGTWRFKYTGTWATDGKSGWQPEYQVNETPMTAAQLAAINSGITAGLVSNIPTAPNIVIELGVDMGTGTMVWSGANSIADIRTAYESGANVTITAPLLTDEVFGVFESWWQDSSHNKLWLQSLDNDMAYLQIGLQDDNSVDYTVVDIQGKLTAGTGIHISGNIISTNVDTHISDTSPNPISSKAAYYAAIGGKLNVGISTNSWNTIANIEPYTHYFDLDYSNVPGVYITNDSVVELINDNPVNWAKYGFAVYSVDTLTYKIRFVSIGKPTGSTTLNLFIRGDYQ